MAKTEAGSPFSSIFSVLKPAWKQHRKISVTRMSGWVREQGGEEELQTPGIELGLRESAPLRTMNWVERVREPLLSTAPEQSRALVSLIHHLSRFQVPSTRQALWASQKPVELRCPAFSSTPSGVDLMILPVLPPAY